MAAREFSQFRERKAVRGGAPPPMGKAGSPGAEASGMRPTERTVAWPSPGPTPGIGFNRTVKAHVVKTTARKAGLDA